VISRKHPVANWLLLPPHEHRRALDRVLDFRDKDPNPNASGLPPAAVDYFWQTELPALLTRPYLRQLAQEHIAMLNAKAADLKHRIEVQSGSMQREAAAAQSEADRIAALLQEVQP
jgi:hypothetical protein